MSWVTLSVGVTCVGLLLSGQRLCADVGIPLGATTSTSYDTTVSEGSNNTLEEMKIDSDSTVK